MTDKIRKDLLFFVESSTSRNLEVHSSTQAIVPTLATISEVCPATLKKDDLEHSSQVSIKNPSQASTVVLCLLSVLCCSFVDEPNRNEKAYNVVPGYAWILSCLTRIWTVVAPDSMHPIATEASLKRCLIFLDTIRSASSPLAATKYESSTASKTFVLLAQAISTLLHVNSSQSSAALERSICLGLVELANLIHHESQAVNEHVLPALLEVKNAGDLFDKFGDDLQVRLDNFE